MPSHLSTLGFDVHTHEDFVSLAKQVADDAEEIAAEGGRYLRWRGSAGQELWLQVGAEGSLVGMVPHFASGRSSVRVRVEAHIHRPKESTLDGALHAWALPPEDTEPPLDPELEGLYPFVFDTPDAATYSSLELPARVSAEIAAFAHQIEAFESPDVFDLAQQDPGLRMASQSFIPSGLFSPDGERTEPPEAYALFTGHVVDAGLLENSLTGLGFYWVLVDTLGGRYDVCVDRSLLPSAPARGSIVQGSFWLSGRLALGRGAA
jgi:hypothetical protein